MDLDRIMYTDHVVQVTKDRQVLDTVGLYAPEVFVNLDSEGQMTSAAEADMIRYVEYEGWELLTGYTRQYAYRGPINHPSEFIGGGMAEDILDKPGFYVVVEVMGEGPDGQSEPENIGWVVAYKDNSHGK